MAQRLKNMVGEVYDRLKVISLSYTGKRTSFWNCKCICGNEVEVRRTNLISGNVRSCGCLCKEETGNRFRTHGNINCRAYTIWAGMKQRCNNPNTTDYKYYGGKGIRLCKEWENSFESFFDWVKTIFSAGEIPKIYTLDRIDNEKDYSSSNCKFSTVTEQNRNRTNTRYIEYKGEKRVVSELAELFNISNETVHKRLDLGWSIEKALTQPVKRSKVQK